MPEVLKGWQIDHRIPVALILALVLQFAGLIWWGSGVTAMLNEHARKFVAVEAIEARRTRDEIDLAGRLARLESGIGEIGRSIERLTHQLERSGRMPQD